VVWYVLIFGEALKQFKIEDNLQRVLDKIVEEFPPKPSLEKYFALFVDRKKLFVSSLKISKLEKIVNTLTRGGSCPEFTLTCCDFIGKYYDSIDVLWIYRPSEGVTRAEGVIRVDRAKSVIELWGFLGFNETEASYKNFEDIFNLDDFYIKLQQIKLESYIK